MSNLNIPLELSLGTDTAVCCSYFRVVAYHRCYQIGQYSPAFRFVSTISIYRSMQRMFSFASPRFACLGHSQIDYFVLSRTAVYYILNNFGSCHRHFKFSIDTIISSIARSRLLADVRIFRLWCSNGDVVQNRAGTI